MRNQRISKYAIRLHTLYAGGLVAVSLIVLQDLIGLGKLDLPALMSLIAFAAAIPLLSGMLVIAVVETRYPYISVHSRSIRVIESTFYLGALIDLFGFGAAFWHASLIAGIVFLAMTAFSILIYSIHISNLSDREVLNETEGASEKEKARSNLKDQSEPESNQPQDEPLPLLRV